MNENLTHPREKQVNLPTDEEPVLREMLNFVNVSSWGYYTTTPLTHLTFRPFISHFIHSFIKGSLCVGVGGLEKLVVEEEAGGKERSVGFCRIV